MERVGRRGACLLVFGAFDLVSAASLACPAAESKQAPGIRWVAVVAPLWLWAALWAVPAVLCLVQMWRRDDRAAYASAILIKLLWGGVYLAGGILAGVPRALVSTAVWWAFAGLVAVISTWPEVRMQRRP